MRAAARRRGAVAEAVAEAIAAVAAIAAAIAEATGEKNGARAVPMRNSRVSLYNNKTRVDGGRKC